MIKTTPALSLVRSITIGAVATYNIELNKAGTTAYIAGYALNKVFAVNLSNDTVVPINVAGTAQALALAPDGRYLWVPTSASSRFTRHPAD